MKRKFLVFFAIVFSIYGLINLYIFIRGWNAIYPQYRTFYLVIFLFWSLSYLIGRYLERKALNWFSKLLVWIGAFWLAAFVYFLLFVLIVDALNLINLIIPIYPSLIFKDYELTKQIVFIALILITFVIIIFGYINARNPRIKELNLKINKTAGGLKTLTIAAASDIHLGTIINSSRLKLIVKKINLLNPDIVLLPGDVVDENIEPVVQDNVGDVLKEIKSNYGTFAITGNHEYIGGVEQACKYLFKHEVVVLRDNYVKIANSFYLVGREDRSIKSFAGKKRKELTEIMNGIDKSLPIILMDHQPVKLIEAQQNGVDFQLSGHTHHGQLWPFNYITQKIFEVSRGSKKIGSTHYYISCGVGTWGPPIRTGNSPEILNITLTFL